MKSLRTPLVGCLTLAAALLAASGVARALPTQLARSEFEALTTGNPTTQVEDFESFFGGLQPNPLTLANGIVTFVSSTANIGGGGCTSGQCMAGNSGSGSRTFDGFPAGTQLWGTDFAAFAAGDIFDVTVVGGSGTLSLDDVAPSDFFGFSDPLGLTSVAFQNVSAGGQSNYSFDDVTTAVPEPASALLFGLGLLGLARRRRAPTA